MKKYLLLFLSLSPLFLWSQQASQYQDLFWQQVNHSCDGRSEVAWEKSVEEVGGAPAETHRYRLDCTEGGLERVDQDGPASLPLNEFDFMFEYFAENNFQKEYFDFKSVNKGMHAVRKVESKEETPLEKQVFEVDDKGVLRYALSHIRKENLLYVLEINIEVWFDEQGRYLKHRTETFTEPMLNDGIRTLIQAQIVL